MSDLLEAALSYWRAGLSVIPIRTDKKSPAIDWKQYQTSQCAEWQLAQWYPRYRIGIACGFAGVEMIDFDNKAELFNAWGHILVEWGVAFENLVIQSSARGGRHVIYRCIDFDCVIPGNQKLAQRKVGDEIKTLIETRGQGGQFVAAPSEGYALLQGSLENLPLLTAKTREQLINAARTLNEYIPPVEQPKEKASVSYDDSPAEEYNASHSFKDLLIAHGWTYSHSRGERDYYARPGKEIRDGISASVTNDKVFYNWSSNTQHFEPHKAYSKFHVHAILEHAGDMSAAATAILQARKPDYEIRAVMPEPQKLSWTPNERVADNPLPPALDEWEFEDARDSVEKPVERPDELIAGVAFVGSKISMSSDSKGHKTFFQIDLGLTVAHGREWFGRKTQRGRVLYVNLELCRYSFQDRLRNIAKKRGIIIERGQFNTLHLRGKPITIEQLSKELQKRLEPGEYSLLILDPLYKMLGDRSENDAGDMADLFNKIEALSFNLGFAYLVAHHYAKGNAGQKKMLDRAAGSGVVARDGDTIITLTDIEDDGLGGAPVSMQIECRDMPPVPAIPLRWDHPVFEADQLGLDPHKIKQVQPNTAKEPIPDAAVMAILSATPQTKETLCHNLMTETKRGRNAVWDALTRVLGAPKDILDKNRIVCRRGETTDSGGKPPLLYYLSDF